MDARLEDLRILRLAAMYEDAFESFVSRMTEHDLDEPTRAKLAPLQPERDHHMDRIRALIERLERDIPPEKTRELQRSIVRDIIEVERAASQFYLDHLDRVHDPEVIRLFYQLAAEERRHVEIAGSALDPLVPRGAR